MESLNTLEDIIKQFENLTKYDKDLTLTQARQDTHTAEMKDSKQQNKGAEINKDCTVNINKINTLHNVIVWDKNEKMVKSPNYPKKVRQQNRYKTNKHVGTNISMCHCRIVKKPNRITYQ